MVIVKVEQRPRIGGPITFMSQPQPIQPNQPQYQITALALFPVYGTRAAYQQATGQQAPPFNPAGAIKGWADPAPAGQPYLVFDSTATATGYIGQMTLTTVQAAQLNLPGVYNYPAYVSPPTDAVEVGPYGPVGPASPTIMCLQADAQEIANEIAPLYPGQTAAIVLGQNSGIFHYLWGLDPRRNWYIVFGSVSLLAQNLIEAKNMQGIGYPGHWVLSPPAVAGEDGLINRVYDTPVTAPLAGSASMATMTVPIRPLLPNEQIVHLAGSLFDPYGTWVVERTDMQQPTTPLSTDQQLAALTAEVAQLQAQNAQLQAQVAQLQGQRASR